MDYIFIDSSPFIQRIFLDSQPFLQRIENKGSHVFAKEARLTVGSMIKVAKRPQLLFRVYQIL